MTWEDVRNVTVAALALATAWLQFARHVGGGRARIKQDLEILQQLPPGTDAYRALVAHVEVRVARLVSTEQEARRDPNGIVAAVFLVALAGWVTALAAGTGGYWRFPLVALAAVSGLTALVGFAESVPKRPRDAKGHPIKDA